MDADTARDFMADSREREVAGWRRRMALFDAWRAAGYEDRARFITELMSPGDRDGALAQIGALDRLRGMISFWRQSSWMERMDFVARLSADDRARLQQLLDAESAA